MSERRERPTSRDPHRGMLSDDDEKETAQGGHGFDVVRAARGAGGRQQGVRFQAGLDVVGVSARDARRARRHMVSLHSRLRLAYRWLRQSQRTQPVVIRRRARASTGPMRTATRTSSSRSLFRIRITTSDRSAATHDSGTRNRCSADCRRAAGSSSAHGAQRHRSLPAAAARAADRLDTLPARVRHGDDHPAHPRPERWRRRFLLGALRVLVRCGSEALFAPI